MKTRYKEHLGHGGFLPWLPNLKLGAPSSNKLAKCACGKWQGWLPEEIHSTIPAFDSVNYEILSPVAKSQRFAVSGPKPFAHNVTVSELPLQGEEERICLKLPTGELYAFSVANPVPFIITQWAEILKAEVVKVKGHVVWFPIEEEV